MLAYVGIWVRHCLGLAPRNRLTTPGSLVSGRRAFGRAAASSWICTVVKVRALGGLLAPLAAARPPPTTDEPFTKDDSDGGSSGASGSDKKTPSGVRARLPPMPRA